MNEDNFIILEGYDNNANNIKNVGKLSIQNIKNIANNMNCAGFNSNGDIKESIITNGFIKNPNIDVYIKKQPITHTVTNPSFKIITHYQNDVISNAIRIFRSWEPRLTEIITEMLSKKVNGIFIDVGANLGYYSLLAGSLGYKVVAFEPLNKNYNVFQKSIDQNNFNIILSNKAVTNQSNQTISLQYVNTNMGGASSFQQGLSQQATTITLDDYFKDKEEDIAFIKIDTEGYEPEVILGAQNLIKNGKIGIILVEITPEFRSVELYAQMIWYLLNNNYIMFDIGSHEYGHLRTNTNHLNTLIDHRIVINKYESVIEKIKDIKQTNYLFISTIN